MAMTSRLGHDFTTYVRVCQVSTGCCCRSVLNLLNEIWMESNCFLSAYLVNMLLLCDALPADPSQRGRVQLRHQRDTRFTLRNIQGITQELPSLLCFVYPTVQQPPLQFLLIALHYFYCQRQFYPPSATFAVTFSACLALNAAQCLTAGVCQSLLLFHDPKDSADCSVLPEHVHGKPIAKLQAKPFLVPVLVRHSVIPKNENVKKKKKTKETFYF